MSTEFINDQWRLPNAWNGTESNVNKQSNYSMDFDGSSQYIDTTDKFNFIHNTKIFSISVWVKMDSYNTNVSSVILGNNYTGSQIGFQFWIDNRQNAAGRTETLKFNLWDGTNSSALLEDNVVSDNNWHNYVVVGDGTTLKYYKDGTQLTDTDSLPASTSSTAFANLRLGANTISTPSSYLDGQIDAVSIFDYALSSSQITTLYGSSSTGIGNPITLNPVAFYNLGDKSAFNGANYLVPNIAAQEADGDIAVSYSPYALDFDGVNDYIDCGTNNSLKPTSAYSISGWFKLDDITGTKTIISNDNNNGYMCWVANDKLWFYHYDTTWRIFSSTTTLVADTWYHFVLTWNLSSTTGKIYINGVYDNQGTNFGQVTYLSTPVYIGTYGPSHYFEGNLSNISIYNSELSAAQVTEIYNEGVPSNLNNHSAYSNLVSWWQLGSNSSFNTNWTVLDEKGSNNGTSVNMNEGDIVDGVGSYANGLSSGMGGDEVIGSAPFSDANSLSYNMDVLDRSTDVPN